MGHGPGALEDLVVTPAFWAGKRVLVTGHTGFKGAWACAWLDRLGADVTGIALAPDSTPSLWGLLDLASVASHEVDITDAGALRSTMVAADPEIILHLAAQSLVRRSYRDPGETFAANVMGTLNVLNAARDCPGLQAVVCATSDKAYENVEQIWGYRETDPMGGRDPYSASKGASELVIASMRQSFFAPYAAGGHPARVGAVRAGNVIGGGDWAEDRLIPDIIRGCLGTAGSVTLRAPHSVRPWQHVLEPLRGYMALAERLYAGDPGFDAGWNFGPDRTDERAVIEVADAIVTALGTGEIIIHEDADAPHEAKMLRLDCTKARVQLGWVPAMSFADCVAFTADWYGGWHKGQTARDLCATQIAAYQDLCEARS